MGKVSFLSLEKDVWAMDDLVGVEEETTMSREEMKIEGERERRKTKNLWLKFVDRINKNPIHFLCVGPLIQHQLEVIRVTLRRRDERRHLLHPKRRQPSHRILLIQNGKTQQPLMKTVINQVDRARLREERRCHNAEVLNDI